MSLARLVPVAVAFAGLLLSPARSQHATSREINDAIDRGVERILALQALEGTWSQGNGTARAGVNGLAAYTLIKSGLHKEHEAVRRAIEALRHQSPAQTYDVACVLLAICAHDADEHGSWIQELANSLVDTQNEEGDWGYPSGADLSNTQYAALALRAATLAGAKVPKRLWEDLARAVLEYRNRDGGFGYRRSGDASSTGSMTAAGVGTIAICQAMLTRRGGGVSTRKSKLFAEARESGIEWLSRKFNVRTNPGHGGWLYYYLYGLERVGALADVATFGDHDWYGEGATFIVKEQREDGGWSAPAWDLADTCFALLFLRKATFPETGANRTGGGRSYKTADKHADVKIAATGENPLSIWISSWGPGAREACEWPGEKGKGPRVARVAYYLDEAQVSLQLADPTAPVEAERFPYRHDFRLPGTYVLTAQVDVLLPPTTAPDGREIPSTVKILESPGIEVTVTNVTPDWLLELARDPARNLLRETTVSADASSVHSTKRRSAEFAANRAVDNRQGTSWVAAEKDERPTLTLKLGPEVVADRLLLSHAKTHPHKSGYYAQALVVEVILNGSEKHTVRMHRDDRRKARLELAKPLRIEKIELVIPMRVPGNGNNRLVGFSEIELQLSSDDDD